MLALQVANVSKRVFVITLSIIYFGTNTRSAPSSIALHFNCPACICVYVHSCLSMSLSLCMCAERCTRTIMMPHVCTLHVVPCMLCAASPTCVACSCRSVALASTTSSSLQKTRPRWRRSTTPCPPTVPPLNRSWPRATAGCLAPPSPPALATAQSSSSSSSSSSSNSPQSLNARPCKTSKSYRQYFL